MRFIPDLKIDKIYEIDEALLKKMDVQALILDIDNTLATHGNPVPAEGVAEWIENMKKIGIPMIIVSNNSYHRVKPFADELGIMFVASGKKPLKKGLRCAAEKMGISPEHVAVVGDQLFTDILGGNRLGMKTILVSPIEEETGRFFRVKRRLENRLMKRYTEKG